MTTFSIKGYGIDLGVVLSSTVTVISDSFILICQEEIKHWKEFINQSDQLEY